MTGNIFDLELTNQALGDLSETIIRLDAALKNKRNLLNKDKDEKNNLISAQTKQIAELKNTSKNVLENIDNIINHIDNMLENNGSSNNNN